MSGSSSNQIEPRIVDLAALRTKFYNATVIDRRDVHSDLIRIRIRPDDGIRAFEAGQYVAIGLGRWESRLECCQPEPTDDKDALKMARRAYSISCSMWENNEIVSLGKVDYLEFYIVLVRKASEPDGAPPLLTPRLFRLQVGDRIEIQKKIVGHYTLAGVQPDENVLMIGTGTGEAPHNAMTATLLAQGHRGKIVNVTTVRQSSDLGYLNEHRILEKEFPNYRYLSLTTRDPINMDPSLPGYVGKRYIQDAYTSGWLAEQAGIELSPKNTHVFLCGNPAMIGYVKPGDPPPATPGMLTLLSANGFIDPSHVEGHHVEPKAGVIRFEKYW
jgi:ferredoxin/flavodoxin---NADP+ reductase